MNFRLSEPEPLVRWERAEESSEPGLFGLAILGSTGSIGRSTLDIVRRFPERFRVEILVAGRNVQLLKEQIAEFRPSVVSLAESESLAELTATGVKVVPYEAIPELLAGEEVDCVVAAIVGFACLPPLIAAVRAGKRIALANKEGVVCGPRLLREAQSIGGAEIIPVDSEHSSLFRILGNLHRSAVERLILTASGGPFLRRSSEEVERATPAEATAHPRWKMGAKISVDSATLMNKALELIEAVELFGFREDSVDVVIHPESVIHGAVQLRDGSVLSHLSAPDMRVPIGYALTRSDQLLSGVVRPLPLTQASPLHFEPVDTGRFPAIALAREALRAQGCAPAVLSLANECAVSLFLRGQIRFGSISRMVAEALSRFAGSAVSDLDELVHLQEQVEAFCHQLE